MASLEDAVPRCFGFSEATAFPWEEAAYVGNRCPLQELLSPTSLAARLIIRVKRQHTVARDRRKATTPQRSF